MNERVRAWLIASLIAGTLYYAVSHVHNPWSSIPKLSASVRPMTPADFPHLEDNYGCCKDKKEQPQ